MTLRPARRARPRSHGLLHATLSALVIAIAAVLALGGPVSANAAATGQPLTAVDAQLSSGAQIAGVAVGIDGAPIAEVGIHLFRIDSGTFTASGSRETDSTGSFLFNGLEPGDYTLEFEPRWESNHLRTWWGGSADQAEAAVLHVEQDQPLTGLRAQLRPGAVVTGVLTDPNGDPLVGHVVELLGGSGCEAISWEKSLSSGVFTFSGLEPGTYSLYFWAGGPDDREFIGEYWLDRPECSLADRFVLSQGQVLSGLDAELSTRPVDLPAPSLSTFSPFVGVPVVAEVTSPAPGVEFEYQWFVDRQPVAGERGQSFVPRSEHFGADVGVRVVATAPGHAPNLWRSTDWGPVREVTRLAGADRYATAVSISESVFQPNVPVAYIASGAGFADALAGGVLAVQEKGPILLSRPDTLPEVVAAELQRLRPQRIVILGGTAVIAPSIEQQLEGLTPGPVTRLAGDDRYATAIAISETGFEPGVPIAFLASGQNYPDALAGAPIAGELGGPLLLTPRSAILQTVKDELARLQPERLVVLGGDGAISGQLGYEIDALAPNVTYVAGSDRYETAMLLSSYFPGVSDVSYVASGADFPDALAGAPIAGLAGERVLLTPPGSLHAMTRQGIRWSMPGRIVVLGGSGAVSDNVETELETMSFTG